jgi:selenocysteine lyase/cysteine desulfurase
MTLWGTTTSDRGRDQVFPWRGGNLRVSFHLYNDAIDVETLLGALDTLT